MTIEERVIEEANNYFDRNINAITDADGAAYNTHIAADFVDNYLSVYPESINTVLEIGCNYGYNLNYLNKRFGIECYGIEPSDKAVKFGVDKYLDTSSSIHIIQGISNNLPYDNAKFDMIMMGFLMYVTPREMIDDTISEVNRVLKEGGFLVLTDFDTPLPYKRINRHNEKMPVYKDDYARRFVYRGGYSVAEKRSYTHSSQCFSPDIQERVSTQILYKEFSENLYVNA